MNKIQFGHIADTHITRKNLKDSMESHDFIVKELKKRNTDFLILAGDLWDTAISADDKGPLNVVIDKFEELSKEIPILIIKGNHDPEGSLSVFNKIADKRIAAIEDPFKIIGFHNKEFNNFDYYEKNKVKPTVLFYIITYPEKSKLLTADQIKKSKILQEDVNNKIEELLLEANEKTKDYDCYKIVVFHGSVQNYKKCEGQSSPGGTDFQVKTKTLNLINPHYVAMGHIHIFQTFGPLYPKTCYSGSTWATNSGETDDKFLCFVKLDNNSYNHEKIKIKCRKQITYDINLTNKTKTFKDLEKLYKELQKNKYDYFRIKITYFKEDFYKLKDIKSINNIKIIATPILEKIANNMLEGIQKIRTINDEINLYFEYKDIKFDSEIEKIILDAHNEYITNLNMKDVTLS